MNTDATVSEGRVSAGFAAEPWMRASAWGILSFGAFVASLLVLVWPVGQLQRQGIPHEAALGLWAFAWTTLSGALTLVAARVSFGTWPEVRVSAWVALFLGALISAAHIWVLVEWAVGRYGYSDPDYIGPTFALFAVVAGVAVAGFGARVAPRGAAWVPRLAVVGGVAAAMVIMVGNLPGLADGLAADSGLLAAATLAAVLYVGAVAILSFLSPR